VVTFLVPPEDRRPWPSLGRQVVTFLEERAVFGPGSLKGQPARLDAETKALIWRAYEVFPKRHPLAGQRRFRRVRISLRKGSAKTEKLGWVAYAELHPEAPVRCDGFDAKGEPVGRPVRDPYIPLLAYTKDQVEELAYGVLKYICEEGPDADLFDVSLERIIRLDENGRADGKAVPLANSPGANDGARTTFNGYDETHRLVLPRQVEAYNTMEANLPKRPLEQPWSMGITTAGEPGQRSVAETDKDEAEAIARGEVEDPELLYYHREAGPNHDLTTMTGRLEAVREASGPAIAEWSDLRGIAKQWDRKGVDRKYLERVWLNRWTQAEAQAFDVEQWWKLQRKAAIPDGAPVTLGFDGSKWKDTTGLIATDVRTGLQTLVGLWRPSPDEPIPVDEVTASVRGAFERWSVVRLYGDPAAGWDTPMAEWAAEHGDDLVIFFYTDSRNQRKMATACRSFASAIRSGEVTHDGNPDQAAHIGAAQKRDVRMVDDDGSPLWVITKERHDSENKIDLAMCSVLSWRARLDALAAGEGVTEDEYAYT
jgi:hypothetical protein